MYEKLDIPISPPYLWPAIDPEGGMSFKQWNAVMMLATAVLISGWLLYDLTAHPVPAAGVAAVAQKLLWAGLWMILINIAAAIGTAIVGSIVTRKEFKDEAADERDRAIYARSLRNAYFVVSVGGIVTLFALALGYDPTVAAYAVFFGGAAAGAAGAISQLVYYRIG
jgi:hypothetical protein